MSVVLGVETARWVRHEQQRAAIDHERRGREREYTGKSPEKSAIMNSNLTHEGIMKGCHIHGHLVCLH